MSGIVVTMTGTGGTGKTSVLNAIKDAFESAGRGDRLVVLPSVVRSFYAKHGIKDENAFVNSQDKILRTTFQKQLMEHYLTTFNDAAVEARKNKQLLLADRSIYDHVAYSLYTASQDGTLTSELLEFCEKAKYAFFKNADYTFYFPYPAPWTQDASAVEDGFRKVDTAKDTIVDALIARQIHKHCDVHTLTPIYKKGPNVRASELLMVLLREEGANPDLVDALREVCRNT